MTRTYVQRPVTHWWLLLGRQEKCPQNGRSVPELNHLLSLSLFISFLAENAPFVAGEQKPPYGAWCPGVAAVPGWESRAGTVIPWEGPPKRAPVPRGGFAPVLFAGSHQVLPQKCWHQGRGRAGAVVVTVTPNLSTAPRASMATFHQFVCEPWGCQRLRTAMVTQLFWLFLVEPESLAMPGAGPAVPTGRTTTPERSSPTRS